CSTDLPRKIVIGMALLTPVSSRSRQSRRTRGLVTNRIVRQITLGKTVKDSLPSGDQSLGAARFFRAAKAEVKAAPGASLVLLDQWWCWRVFATADRCGAARGVGWRGASTADRGVRGDVDSGRC